MPLRRGQLPRHHQLEKVIAQLRGNAKYMEVAAKRNRKNRQSPYVSAFKLGQHPKFPLLFVRNVLLL